MLKRRLTPDLVEVCLVTAAPCTSRIRKTTMKNNKNDEKQQVGKAKKELTTNSFRQSTRKAPGTRMGTWEDWRGGSSKSGKVAGRHGHAIRDGR